MAGKIKMWFQCIVVVASLLALAMGAGGDEVPQWLLITIGISAWSKLAKTGASISVVNQDVVLRGRDAPIISDLSPWASCLAIPMQCVV